MISSVTPPLDSLTGDVTNSVSTMSAVLARPTVSVTYKATAARNIVTIYGGVP